MAEARRGRRPDLDHVPVALAGQQGRLGEIRDLAGMIVMIMADADIGGVSRVEADPSELRDDLFLEEGAFRVQIGRAHAELQSLMRISYAVFCLKNTKRKVHHNKT